MIDEVISLEQAPSFAALVEPGRALVLRGGAPMGRDRA